MLSEKWQNGMSDLLQLTYYVRAAVGESVFIYASCTSQIRGQMCEKHQTYLHILVDNFLLGKKMVK